MSGCTIQLDHFQGHYFTGSIISGRVVCNFRKAKNIKGIKINLKGTEYTGWTEWESFRNSNSREPNRKRPVHYRGENNFYRMETTLVGPGEICPGMLQYPFRFTLPKNLPGTYYGKHGWVKYHIKAAVERSYKFDYQDVRELVIIALVDFNEIVGQLQLSPVSYSVNKTLCCWCCASGPIVMAVHLEKEAFVLGEAAKVGVEIKNTSDKAIESVSVEIGMKIESRVTSPRTRSRREYQPLAISTDTGVGANGERSYIFMLQIPAVSAIPNFNLCTLFTQWFKLKVTAVLPAPHKNLKSSTRIVMGHIPVGQHVQLQISSYLPSQVPTYQPESEPIYEYCDVGPYASTSGVNPASVYGSSNLTSLESNALPGSDQSATPGNLYLNVPPYPSSVSTITSSSSVAFTPVKFEPPTTSISGESGAKLSDEAPPPSYDDAIYTTKESKNIS